MGSDEELKGEVNKSLNRGLAASEYNIVIVKLLNSYEKCLKVAVDNMEK